jgi:hypothetical protein
VAELHPLHFEEPFCGDALGVVRRLDGVCTHSQNNPVSGSSHRRFQHTAAAGSRGHATAEAAGIIHTDPQYSFVHAEIVAINDLIALGGMNEAKAKGKLRLEGKEYPVQDGEILHVRFNL